MAIAIAAILGEYGSPSLSESGLVFLFVLPENFGGAYSRRLVCPSVRMSHSCPAHNFVI